MKKPFPMVAALIAMTAITSGAHAQSPSMLIVPKLGVALPGGGSLKLKDTCSGSLCDNNDEGEETIDFDGEGADLVLGGDVLFGLTDLLYVGPGLGIVMGTELQDEDASTTSEIGTTFNLDAILEARFRVSEDLTIPVRGQLGMLLLKKSDELDEAMDDLEEICEDLDGPGEDCRVGGPLGMHLALGAGLAYNVGTVKLRGDFLYSYDWLRLMKLKQSIDDTTLVGKSINRWGRVQLLFGVEI